MQRKLAAAAALTHIITMDTNLTVFRLQEKSGILDTDTEYVIGDDVSPIETVFGGGKKFMDTVCWTYGDSGVCLHVRKVSHPDGTYELNAYRYLEDNGNTIRCVVVYCPTASYTGKHNKKVTAVSYFSKTGPSPNVRPESVAEADDGSENTPAVGAAGAGQAYSKAPVSSDDEIARLPGSRVRSVSISTHRERINSRARAGSVHTQHIPRGARTGCKIGFDNNHLQCLCAQ
jgi:hypothetical protein